MTRVLVACVVASSLALAAAAADKPAQPAGQVRHVVLFKFKDGTPAEKIAEVEKAFAELPKKIDVIADFEWGTDCSPEGKAQGFTHCFFLTFRDAAGRDAYLPHPEHKAFGRLLRGHLDKVLVVDYVPKK